MTEPSYFDHYKGLVQENMRKYPWPAIPQYPDPVWSSPWWAAVLGGGLTLSALRVLYQNPLPALGVAYDAGRRWVDRELRHGI